MPHLVLNQTPNRLFTFIHEQILSEYHHIIWYTSISPPIAKKLNALGKSTNQTIVEIVPVKTPLIAYHGESRMLFERLYSAFLRMSACCSSERTCSTNYPRFYRVTGDVMLHVEVPRPPDAEVILGHLDRSLVVVVDLDIIVYVL